MPYTEYKFKPKWIKKRTAELTEALKKNTGKDNLLRNGVRIICDRLEKDPQRYRDYGPYWWALKKVLAKYAPHIIIEEMDAMDEEIANEYKGSTETETLVMADEFRNDYLGSFFLYSNEFFLDLEGSLPYQLYDPNMEQWAFAKKIGF